MMVSCKSSCLAVGQAGFEPATCLLLVDTDRRNEQTNSGFVSLLRSSASPLTYIIVFSFASPLGRLALATCGGVRLSKEGRRLTRQAPQYGAMSLQYQRRSVRDGI